MLRCSSCQNQFINGVSSQTRQTRVVWTSLSTSSRCGITYSSVADDQSHDDNIAYIGDLLLRLKINARRTTRSFESSRVEVPLCFGAARRSSVCAKLHFLLVKYVRLYMEKTLFMVMAFHPPPEQNVCFDRMIRELTFLSSSMWSPVVFRHCSSYVFAFLNSPYFTRAEQFRSSSRVAGLQLTRQLRLIASVRRTQAVLP